MLRARAPFSAVNVLVLKMDILHKCRKIRSRFFSEDGAARCFTCDGVKARAEGSVAGGRSIAQLKRYFSV